MKTPAFFCFACARDEALLPLHYAAIRRITASAPVFYVIPEGESVAIPAGAEKIESSWERGDRLSGVPAVRGILATIAATAPLVGADTPCVKIDADTVLTSADWLQLCKPSSPYVGFESWHPMLPTGACYAITPELAARCLAMTDPWPWQDEVSRLPEDRTIYLLAMQSGHGQPRVLPFSGHFHMLAFSPSWYAEPADLAPGSGVCAVHCGERPQMQRLEALGLDRTTQVSRAMRCCLRVLKNRHS